MGGAHGLHRDLVAAYRFTDVNGTRPGYGICSIDFLDGQAPSRELYCYPPSLRCPPVATGARGTSDAKAVIKDRLRVETVSYAARTSSTKTKTPEHWP